MKTPPFDRALELHDLDEAAADYAARHGDRGSDDYRAAWLSFRRRIRTVDDLRRLRRAARERMAKSAADRGKGVAAHTPRHGAGQSLQDSFRPPGQIGTASRR